MRRRSVCRNFSAVGLVLAFASVFAVTGASAAEAQKSPSQSSSHDTIATRASTTAQGQASTAGSIAALLAPGVGYLLGHSVAGTNGGFVGFSIGSVAGIAIAIVDAHRQDAHREHPASPSGNGLCFVPGAPGTPDQIIPGTPPTPPIGDMPGSPGTPDTIIPGTPGAPDRWE